MKNIKLFNIRRKLDKLDDKFLKLIKKRTLLVNQVLLTKKYKNQIVDKKRIKKILSNIKSKSIKKRIDTKITNEIWTSMIRAYIKYEFRNFLESYNRTLTSRDADKYVDGDDEVVTLTSLANQFGLLRNQYLGIMKGLDTKQWQIGHIVKLRTAGMEDISI